MLLQTAKIKYLGWEMNELQVFIYNNIMIFVGKPKYLENDLFKSHFVHNQSHLDFLESDPELYGDRPATNCLNIAKHISYL